MGVIPLNGLAHLIECQIGRLDIGVPSEQGDDLTGLQYTEERPEVGEYQEVGDNVEGGKEGN